VALFNESFGLPNIFKNSRYPRNPTSLPIPPVNPSLNRNFKNSFSPKDLLGNQIPLISLLHTIHLTHQNSKPTKNFLVCGLVQRIFRARSQLSTSRINILPHIPSPHYVHSFILQNLHEFFNLRIF